MNSDYWCSKNGEKGGECGLSCKDLLDDDITDDIKCAKQVLSKLSSKAWELAISNFCFSTAKVITKQCLTNDKVKVEASRNYYSSINEAKKIDNDDHYYDDDITFVSKPTEEDTDKNNDKLLAVENVTVKTTTLSTFDYMMESEINEDTDFSNFLEILHSSP